MSQFTFYANKPSENYHKIDMGLLASMLLLWGTGIFTLFVCSQNYAERAFNGNSFYFVTRQLVCSAFGFVLFFMFLITDVKIVRRFIGLIVIASLILCLLTFVPSISIEKNGARRWLRMPGNFTFQPSELIKFALVMFLANYFDKQSKIEFEDEKTVLPCVVGFVVLVSVVLLQKDFSTSVFITLIGILVFVVSGSKIKWIIPFMIIVIPVGILMVSLEKYRLDRIIGFLRPDAVEFSTNINYQTLMSKRAISAGGVWGSGIGAGLVRINSIPEIQADYIFAGWAEAMGFAGVFVYFVLLGFFAWRGYRTALLCPDRFASYASFGCVSIIFLQSLVNCMVVCGMIPSTGIPLPFFSLGGSSIIVTLAMCGFILSASRCEESSEKIVKTDEINIESLTVL